MLAFFNYVFVAKPTSSTLGKALYQNFIFCKSLKMSLISLVFFSIIYVLYIKQCTILMPTILENHFLSQKDFEAV
jgi:hypothetical protein